MPLPLSTNVTPAGSATPPSVRVGSGNPVAVTVKVPAAPIVNLIALALVIAGACFTVNVKLCVTGVPTPLVAVNVNG